MDILRVAYHQSLQIMVESSYGNTILKHNDPQCYGFLRSRKNKIN